MSLLETVRLVLCRPSGGSAGHHARVRWSDPELISILSTEGERRPRRSSRHVVSLDLLRGSCHDTSDAANAGSSRRLCKRIESQAAVSLTQVRIKVSGAAPGVGEQLLEKLLTAGTIGLRVEQVRGDAVRLRRRQVVPLVQLA